jgi:hypothetical protein
MAHISRLKKGEPEMSRLYDRSRQGKLKREAIFSGIKKISLWGNCNADTHQNLVKEITKRVTERESLESDIKELNKKIGKLTKMRDNALVKATKHNSSKNSEGQFKNLSEDMVKCIERRDKMEKSLVKLNEIIYNLAVTIEKMSENGNHR